ncbi:MAG: two-component system, NtrC family, C4-dicarboxylate transport sensor histidine kinase DctB [Patescibacteria group bacterium]|nr:two-component system, NtrC family, C4-dicarboxylate transport sensor histidine kinase DctB [Patescibacteria group bacterium]
MDSLNQNIFRTIQFRIQRKIHSFLRVLCVLLLEPKDHDNEKYRKELVCNILLLFTLSLLAVLDVLVLVNYTSEDINYIGIHPLIMFGITGSTLCLLFLSRIGYTVIVSQSVIWTLIAGGIYGQAIWGADLPSIILLWSFVITTSSILISTRYSFYLSVCIGFGTIILQALASRGIFTPSTAWKTHGFKIDDAIEYAVVFILIAGVSWISNREIFRSLLKAKQAKIELQEERNLLEIKVTERTEQLHKAQVEKINSMYQLVEFGRISSGLFHDLMTPLNTLSLLILQLKDKGTIDSHELSHDVTDTERHLDRCIQTSKKINDFINLTKRQIQNNQGETRFKVYTEIKSVIAVLQSKAQRQNVHILFYCRKNIHIHGSTTLFSHIITNLISNAIDSYNKQYEETHHVEESTTQENDTKTNRILIYCTRKKEYIEIKVRDFGAGIPLDVQPHIFETFFTTKSSNSCGIGLSATKHTVEKYFKGTISFISIEQNKTISQNAQHGTVFIINIPNIKYK